MKLTFIFDIPEEAPGSVKVECARQMAADVLEKLEHHWPDFRKCAAREPDGRFWLYIPRPGRPPPGDRLIVITSECRARSTDAEIEEFQAVVRAAISEFEGRYIGFTRALFNMMREEKPLGLILKRLLRFRPLGQIERRRPPRMKFWKKYAHIPSP